MNQIEVMVTNPDIRNMFQITQFAAKTSEKVELIKGNAVVDAKSILGVISLGIREGQLVIVRSEDLETVKKIAGIL